MKRFKKGLKIYISGAVIGTEDYQKRFAEAERFLKENGDIIVLNPVNNFDKNYCKNYAEFIEREMCMLKDADAVFALLDVGGTFLTSTDVDIVIKVAIRRDIPVFAYTDVSCEFYRVGDVDITPIFDEEKANKKKKSTIANVSLFAAAQDMYEFLQAECEYCISRGCERCKRGELLKRARGEK